MDWGSRLALYRKWTGGIYQTHGSINVEIWRRWPPLFLSGAITALICPPLEVAYRAFKGDQTFPAHLRYGYQSPFHALFKIASESPSALYKNSSPSIAASFIQTTMAISIYEVANELLSPIVNNAHCPNWTVKGL